MFCKYCGKELDNSAKFCSSCGTRIEQELPITSELIAHDLTEDTVPNAYDEQRSAASRSILAMGICSLAFVCSFFLSLVGFIIACVCRGKIKSYEASFGPVSGAAKVGKHLARGGLIGGIFMTIFTVLYVVFYVILLVEGISGSYYDWNYLVSAFSQII